MFCTEHNRTYSDGIDDDIRARYNSAVFPDILGHVPDVFVDVIHKSWHLKYASSQELLDDMHVAYKAFCTNHANQPA